MADDAMTSRPIDIVRHIYEAFARGDLEAVMERCAPDAVVTQDPRLPWGGRYVGRDGIAEFAIKLVDAIDSVVTPESIFEAGNQVVQHGHTRGTVRQSGAAFELDECHIWTLRDGMVAEAAFFIDSDAMLAALDG